MVDATEQLRSRLEELFEAPEVVTMATSIVGSADPGALAERAVAITEELAGASCATLLHASFSLGAVFGWELANGARVATKLHAPKAEERELRAAYGVMAELGEGGFPCPRLLAPPARVGESLVVLSSWLDVEEAPPSSEAAGARARAGAFARLVREASASEHASELRPPDPLASPFPSPHSAIFDFEATRAGAEAIDRIGQWTAEELGRCEGPLVVTHGDFCAHNVLLAGDEVAAVFDWDSLHRERRAIALGVAALASGFDTRRALDPPPTARWVNAFLAAYEAEAGALDELDARTARVAALRTFAYMARCQQAYADANGRDRADFPFPTRLATFEAELGVAAA